ncbi:maleylpyruvate isomerase family mycothiol-dependent enzyme [Pseudonocardia sp. KRD291]|uniref:maleylpyruvate isomerase family mycothiol-dependent enzyme n=1 Tax=Pseudonocardia sp. KRD291 TaxID=2792007 RepID=UPI001C4A734D|nr:maleylpyruvate isomerase family mycothiol-dependent enzyme [Pseudonocardia sp. KRD291]MBW0105078.1 maleylpyruvate isomerase family mycothiol-dependent enzyme [Pseudonocardia sp. KRD291]
MLAHVEAERLGLADVLDTLDEGEWATPSLCAAWTVHELVAHLTLSNRTPFAATMLAILRARGDFDRVEADAARQRARRHGPAELVAQLRETAGLDRRFPLAGRLDPLVDILVHGQDIVRPLGRSRAMPVERVVPALEQVWRSPFLGLSKRFAGIRFVATDAGWSRGEGTHELRGPAGELLLVSTGRPAGLAAVHGPALAEVTARLTAS